MKNFATLIGTGIMAAFVYITIALLMALPVMWITNTVLSPTAIFSVFGVYQLTFGKAFWLAWLCSLLFKNSSYSKKD